MRLALYGFGNVGQALARILIATKAPFTVTAIVARRGETVNPAGLDLATKLAATNRPAS